MAIKAYLIFFKAWVLSLFGAKKEKLLIHDLFHKFSYRYNNTLASSYRAPLVYLKKSIQLIFTDRTYTPDSLAWKTCVFAHGHEYKAGRKDYLKYNGVVDTNFVFREQLPNDLGFFARVTLFLFLFFVFVCILPFSLFRTDKAKASLILLEIAENALLYRSLKSMNIKKLYFFSAFEKDAYFTCYLLQSGCIEVSMVPSGNPLSFYYERVFCTQFVFTAAFQQLEYHHLKSNWIVGSTVQWKPFESQSVKLNSGEKKHAYDIGLVSSGMQLRAHLGHTNALGKNDYYAEMALVKALQEFRTAHQKSLIVYLHPFEKSSKEHLEFSKAYYKELFGADVSFAPLDESSKLNFHLAAIGISGFSSAQIERLYGGYRTLFAPMGFLKNYFKDERLDKISVNDYPELETSILKLLGTSDEDFFKEYHLTDYHWKAYEMTGKNG